MWRAFFSGFVSTSITRSLSLIHISFDSYLYQLVESKQKFIGQIMTSKSPVRSAAVSYTHLDVYKRQGLQNIYGENDRKKSDESSNVRVYK